MQAAGKRQPVRVGLGVQGGTLEVSGSGEDFKVNGNSSVVCGNVQTANATVYLIDQVLLPTS